MNSILPSVLTRLYRLISHLRQDRRGSIALMGAFSILALLGVASLTVELGQGYSRRAINQHITDAAAYAAAFYYTDGGTANVAAMTQAAQDLASANGIANSAVSFSLLATSPGNSSKSAVQVNITNQVPISLAGLFNLGSSFAVTTSAIVEVNPSGSCIMALNPNGGGITVALLSAIVANQCNIASATSINVGLLASVCAASINYGTSISTFFATIYTTPNCAQGGTHTSATTKVAPTVVLNADPLKDPTNRVQTSFTELDSSMPTATVPSLPTALATSTTSSCPTITAAGSYSGTCYKSVTVPAGATVTLSATQLQLGAVTVNSLGTLKIPNATSVQTSAGVTVTGGTLTASTPLTLFDVNGGFSNSGTVSIANSQYVYVRGALTTSNTLSFGATSGVFYAASLSSSGSTSFGGSGSYYFGTINNTAGTLTFGDSTGFYLTGSSNGYSVINTAGTMTFGNGSLISNGGFIIYAGVMNLGNPNGGTTGEYDINGNLYLSAGIVNLGNDGLYLIDGTLTQFAGTYLNGANDTIITSGNITIAALSYFQVTAPTSALNYAIRNVALASDTGKPNYNGSVSFAGLSGAGVQGAFYFPYASLNVVAGASLVGINNGCLQLIAAQITDAALAFNATSCPGLNGLKATSGSLIQ